MNNKSHLTAIKRTKLSAPMKYLVEKGLIQGETLDYGCGKGFDAEELQMDKYDPHFQPELPTNKRYDTITCNYVLNVIEDSEMRDATLGVITLLLKDGGTAYITVRRDKFKEGFNSRGTYQTIVELGLPVLHEKKGSYATYILHK